MNPGALPLEDIIEPAAIGLFRWPGGGGPVQPSRLLSLPQ